MARAARAPAARQTMGTPSVAAAPPAVVESVDAAPPPVVPPPVVPPPVVPVAPVEVCISPVDIWVPVPEPPVEDTVAVIWEVAFIEDDADIIVEFPGAGVGPGAKVPATGEPLPMT